MEEEEEEEMEQAAPEEHGECAKYFRVASDFVSARSADSFLPMAITLPGILHIVHNLLSEVNEHMHHWGKFYEGLKQVSLLLREGRRERFIQFCVRPSSFSGQASAVEVKSFAKLHEARFGDIGKFCTRILP